MVKPVWNNAQRVNHQNFAKKTHSCAKTNMVPRAVLMKSGLVSVNTARQVNTAHLKTTVNAARPISYLSKTTHSTVKQPIHKNTPFKNSNINQRVNTVRGKNVNTARPKAVINAVKENNFNDVKASACWIQVSDSLGNMSYLIDYEEIDEGYVTFGGNLKGGKITRKGTIKTGNLYFENVYFVRELKFNLFSVLQMYDKKNSVLFNDIECIVLSPNFKLIDESQDLLSVGNKSSSRVNTAKALGYLNFKTMNKLVKGNLVRGLPSKLFENDQTCVACQKGKQHRASLDHKVKVIRCDNGTEFKNREMNQFCEMNGILRQFSVARTPQQNGVAERRNRTLIEAARTMLADSKLPTTFWAEAVNTACYVQNRVLVVKPHNKTPYELFHGRTPTLSFMRPFGCPVTILNTIDHLGKFDGKADEGFFVGYFLNNKAFRVVARVAFDIDALTRTMNYEPIVAGTQSNGFAGTKASDNASQARKETEHVKDYILLPLWTTDQPFIRWIQGFNVNAAGTNEVYVVGGKTSIKLPFDPNMHALKDYSIFDFSRDDEDDGAVADMKNLDTTIQEEPKKALKWVFRNKKDERGIVIRNKERFVAQGHTQEEGIDYDEVFAPIARIEAISAFLYGKIEEEVYVCQPPGFEDPNFPDKVYKQKKDDIFISQDKYVAEILKKFRFIEVKTASTPMETQKPLLKDEDGEEVDVYMYRSMIGSLMYLTSSRPDIMFAVCACARYQVNPKVSHLHAVKRIFRYLKGQSKLGLWYPKDSPFDLVAYTDSDYAGENLV
ncbi:retrovirus-related pol polyprotein from transposon TNT 1-94 [Tanacetum coccineum]|uniref:Retrovirus-related pol polyprotein from transposon TNT 1-94 n=1 Tax=Tanacetum coccineum TaxID=301880 RepID=A0ABQ5J2G1_9ASTR